MFIRILMFFVVTNIYACTNSSTVILGEVGHAITSSEVAVLYDTNPNCEFVVVALMQIPGDHYSRGAIIEKFRRKAARLGVSTIQITHLQKIGSTEYLGSARALRCSRA